MKQITKTYVDRPVPIAMAEYQACCDLVVANARANADVTSVYLMGSQWQPGVSDLDLIVVYKSVHPVKFVPSPWQLSARTKHIFTHGYLSFTSRSFSSFYYLYPKEIAQLRLLYGEDQKLVSPDSPELTKAILFDVLINKLMLFPRYISEPVVPVRRLIGELFSLNYTAKMVKEFTGDSIGRDFLSRISTLRANWFKQDEEANLIELMNLVPLGVALVEESVRELSAVTPAVASSGATFANARYRVEFSNKWRQGSATSEFARRSVSFRIPLLSKKVERHGFVLPTNLSYYLSAYAAEDGAFSKLIRDSFAGPKTAELATPIREHSRVVNQVFEEAQKSDGQFKVPFSYGFPLRAPSVRQKVYNYLVVRFT